MPAQFTIKVTREIIEFSKECGTKNKAEVIGENCAVANALKHIFPAVMVTSDHIYPFGIDENNKLDELKIAMPKIAQDFIKVFDSLSAIHNVRLLLPEFEFDIVIPDEIISQINIDEIKKIVEEKPELHLRHNAIL